jgi:hypothetical protein
MSTLQQELDRDRANERLQSYDPEAPRGDMSPLRTPYAAADAALGFSGVAHQPSTLLPILPMLRPAGRGRILQP